MAGAATVGVPDEGIDPEVYRRRWWTLGVLCLSLLIIMVGNTALNVAIPVLSEELNASNSELQWIVDAYSLVFAGLLFVAGNIGDRYGRKGILQFGLVLFALATGYAAFVADSAADVIASRVAMGVAGAAIMPATLSIITNVFPREERARAVAMWAGISGAGTALGPLLTGWVLEHADWNWVFAVNLPFVATALVLGVRFVPRIRSDHGSPFDLPGAVLSAVGLVAVVYAIIEAPAHGWLAPETLIVGGLGLLVLAAFVAWELHVESPMLDVRLFRIRAFGVSSLSLTLVFFALMGMFFSMSQLLQLVYGYSPLNAAVRLLPISVAVVIASTQSARVAERFGKRRTVAVGMWMIALGTGSLAASGVDPNYPLLVIGLVVMASGMGLAMSPTTDLLMSTVPREKAGMGSAMNDTVRELGGSLGVAIIGSILASRYAHGLSDAVSGTVPDDVPDVATESLGGALGAAQQLGDGGVALVDAARESWVEAFQYSVLVGSLVVAISGLIAWRFLPDRAADVTDPTVGDVVAGHEPEPQPLAAAAVVRWTVPRRGRCPPSDRPVPTVRPL
ncbi:MAG: MFS transporter [Actinomycetota bacterium]|nr:MFS transporter [Actinomycetota bacterium]